MPVDLVHIIDHSNSVYLPHLKKITSAKKIITCHDLIAIRTARGEFDQAPTTSSTGKYLQRRISQCLQHAEYFPCDSTQTQKDLNRLFPFTRLRSPVIHLSTESTSERSTYQSALDANLPFAPNTTPYLLHVGTGAWYKNRKGVIHAFRHICEQNFYSNIKLVLVGPMPQTDELGLELASWLDHNQDSYHILQNLPEESLQILYDNAKALIFPSHIEGFGWPPLEAALRKCPVVTSKTGAIHDLLGNYASYINPTDQASINQAVVDILYSEKQMSPSILLPNHHQCRKEYFDVYAQMLGV